MKNILVKFGIASFVISCASLVATGQTSPTVQPDNSRVNKRDTNSGEATADNQKMNADDTKLAAKIRRAVMADKSLSTYAHNIKIISQNGMVTLKGPVKSDEESKSIMAKAVEIAGGADKVFNQLAVKQQ